MKKKVALVLILLYFVMLLVYINEFFFASDEGDVFLVGSAIANGRLLYRDITSQHMPVMYYIAAVFSLFGANTVTEFRICFYFLMAALWGVMYYRYSDYVGKGTMMLYPILYIVLMSCIDLGHAIISDQIQAICMAILLLELMIFEKTRELKVGNQVMISLAVFLSFGSAFVAVFAIFFVALTVILMEINRFLQMGMGMGKALKLIVKTYWKLVVVVALPFAVLLLYYLLTGTLDDFYGWAYVLNREIYPKYNGYGGSVLGGMFGGIQHIMNSYKISILDFSIKQFVQLVISIGAVVFIAYLQYVRKNWILTFGIFFVWIGAATRGVFSFHGTPALSLMCVMNAYLLSALSRRNQARWLLRGVCICLVFVYILPYASVVRTFSFSDMLKGLEVSEESPSHIVDILTNDKEIVGISTFDKNLLFESGTSPTKLSAGCPWIWEFGGEESLQQCIKNPPRLFIYDSTYATWGYPIVEYAESLHMFITENYIPLTELGYRTIYVHHSYYDDAINIIDQDHISRVGYSYPRLEKTVNMEAEEIYITLRTDGKFQQVLFATWTEENGQDDLQWYQAELEGNTWRYIVDINNHEPNGMYYVHTYVTDDTSGEQYMIGHLTFELK